MSESAIKESVPFTFCPKCGAPLANGRCERCGWAFPPTSSYSTAPRRRRRLEFLIAALVLVVLASVGLNFFLNFGSTVSWLPADVLLWMDDGKGDASADLIRRMRDGKLSDRQLTKLVTQRISDPQLALRSPFPVGHEQVIQIEQNCGMPLEGLTVQVRDWKLFVNGVEVSNSIELTNLRSESDLTTTKSKSAKKKSRARTDRQVGQNITLKALEAGTHQIKLIGELTVCRNSAPQEPLYARPVSVSRDVEIKGQLTDYSKPRTDKEILAFLRNASVAHAWWTGEEEDEYRPYSLSIGAAMPGVPFLMNVSVRVGAKGDWTRVGKFGNEGQSNLISSIEKYSLADVPGIEDARRIQVRLDPDLVTAFKGGHQEFFGGIVEWDSVPVHHHAVGHHPNPGTDAYRPPSRVRKFPVKTKETSAPKKDEAI